MQTIYLEKVKKQGKYVEFGKCGYCSEAVNSHAGERYCDEECEDLASQVGGECEICEALTQEGQRFCSRKCGLEKVEELQKKIKELIKDWL